MPKPDPKAAIERWKKMAPGYVCDHTDLPPDYKKQPPSDPPTEAQRELAYLKLKKRDAQREAKVRRKAKSDLCFTHAGGIALILLITSASYFDLRSMFFAILVLVVYVMRVQTVQQHIANLRDPEYLREKIKEERHREAAHISWWIILPGFAVACVVFWWWTGMLEEMWKDFF